MPLFEWKEGYSVGVPSFDRQHKRMFALINGLFGAMQEGRDGQMAAGLLDELASYGREHLKAEEAAFARYGYPKAGEHKAIHDHYREKIDWFRERLGETGLTFEVIDFLEDWWMKHILSADKEYEPFFRDKRLA